MAAELRYILASRRSQLAQIQTLIVRDVLVSAFPSTPAQNYVFDTHFMATAGDKNQAQALYVIGGESGAKSLWTGDLEAALLRDPAVSSSSSSADITRDAKDEEEPVPRVDMLVHSCKDVPTTLPLGCKIGAILERENPVDSLVVKDGLPYKSLDELPEGCVIGTSSIRRVAQLRRKYPHLVFNDVRGNLNTRLAKLDASDGPFTALILAKSGLVRLGMGHRVTADISCPTLYHAVGQGALAVEIRSGDNVVEALCRALNHQPTEWSVCAERAMLRVLEGGCSVPVGVSTELTPIGNDESSKPWARLRMTGTVTSLDGKKHVEHTIEEDVGSIEDCEEIGSKVAKILVNTGAREILEDIAREKEERKKAGAGVGIVPK